jgi:hypothetical protein
VFANPPKKLNLRHRLDSQGPLFRMQWHPVSTFCSAPILPAFRSSEVFFWSNVRNLNTCPKCPRNSRRISTSIFKDLKLLRINTCRKNNGARRCCRPAVKGCCHHERRSVKTVSSRASGSRCALLRAVESERGICCSAHSSNLFRISTCEKSRPKSRAISTCETKEFNSTEMNTCNMWGRAFDARVPVPTWRSLGTRIRVGASLSIRLESAMST